MQLSLKNIGIIQNSTINLDGLTVVTGKNNSGKSTVGKTLYALIDGASDIEQKFQIDMKEYLRNRLEELLSVLTFIRSAGGLFHDKDQNVIAQCPLLRELMHEFNYYKHGGTSRLSEDISEGYLFSLINEINSLDFTALERSIEYINFQESARLSYRKQFQSDARQIIKQQCDLGVSILYSAIDTIRKNKNLASYACESINQTLRLEFSNQIQPVRGQTGPSEITLSDDAQIYFHMSLDHNNISNNTDEPVTISSPYDKAYFIDDPFILDAPEIRQVRRLFDFDEGNACLSPNHVCSHNVKLLRTVKQNRSLSILEQTVLNDTLKKTREKINRVLPGTFEFSGNGDFYVEEGRKLQLSNLATGSKMFAIIKILLDKGELDESTILILDEPEAHLHPQWQNAFAEIIVLLVKELNVNILLTTHSPNFMLALDAYMRKYGISDKTNFYQTEQMKDGFVNYHCVNDDMGKIYSDFLQYLSEVKMLRNEYLDDIEG